MQLPAGTWIVFTNKTIAANFRQLALNETHVGASDTVVVIDQPLVIASPAWVSERNAAELALHKRIDELTVTNPTK